MKGWFDANGRLTSLTSENVEGVACNDSELMGITGLPSDLPLDRTFCIEGKIVVYPPVMILAPTAARTNEIIVITATLPPNSPDTVIAFQVGDARPVEELVRDGKAEAAFVFNQPGVYRIVASSLHHGSASVEVVVQ